MLHFHSVILYPCTLRHVQKTQWRDSSLQCKRAVSSPYFGATFGLTFIQLYWQEGPDIHVRVPLRFHCGLQRRGLQVWQTIFAVCCVHNLWCPRIVRDQTILVTITSQVEAPKRDHGFPPDLWLIFITKKIANRKWVTTPGNLQSCDCRCRCQLHVRRMQGWFLCVEKMCAQPSVRIRIRSRIWSEQPDPDPKHW